MLKQDVAATVLPQDTKELFYRIIDTAEVASLSEHGIAKSMKADGIDNSIIAKYTNLTIAEIEKL